MSFRFLASVAGGAAFAGALLLSASVPASALTVQECSAKYQAAKTAGTLGGQNWNQFRAKNCGDDATPAAAPAAPAAAPKAAAPAPATAATPTTAAVGDIKGGGRAAAQARQKQCGAEWRADTDKLKAQYGSWPKYYSACNTRIKTTGH